METGKGGTGQIKTEKNVQVLSLNTLYTNAVQGGGYLTIW